MYKAIVRFLAILGALWLIGMVIVMVAVIGVKGKVPSKTILEANFEQSFMEDVPETPSAQLLLTEKQTLRDVVDAIDRGAGDDRVVGMIAKIGAAPMGMAQTQEIRQFSRSCQRRDRHPLHGRWRPPRRAAFVYRS